MFAVLKAADLN